MDADTTAAAPRPLIWMPLSFVLVGVVFSVDYVTGAEISVSFFYLFPVALATWMLGRWAGACISVLAAAGWAGASFMSGRYHSQPRIVYWNTAVEVAIFLVITFALAAVRNGLAKEQALKHELLTAYRRLDDEMRIVGEIQRTLLPESSPAAVGFQFATHYSTSARAGGDYYDFFRLSDGQIGLLIADVSGHGTPAAVVMAMLRALLHAAPWALTPPESVLLMLHRQLQGQTLHGQFVTACYATLDDTCRQLEYSIAGHNPPLLVRGGSGRIEELENPSGPPLGVFEAPEYTRRCTRLESGDTVLFYTDGLTEAMDGAGAMFGLERVKALLACHRAEPPTVLRDRLLDAMTRHAGGVVPSDDLTLILVRVG